MTPIIRLPILASPFLLLVVALVVVYNMMDEVDRQVPVDSEVEKLVRVNHLTTGQRYSFEFHPDATVGIRGSDLFDATGQLQPSSQRFVDSLRENSSVYRSYELAGTSVTGDTGSRTLLRKIYFTTSPGVGATQAVYVEEYPLDFDGVWGRYHIRDTSLYQVDVEWTNKGDVIFALLMLFFLGPFFAVFAMWRLMLRFPASYRVKTRSKHG